MNDIKIIDLSFNPETWGFTIQISLFIVFILSVIGLIIWLIIKSVKSKNNHYSQIIPVKMKVSVGGGEVEYDIVRNFTNLEIAHKIYVELITRKAALPFDENHDLIIEVYNSWYSLFQVIRQELKNISGELLQKSSASDKLIELTTDILNKGLRPHLTEHQAKFKKWYTNHSEDNENKNKTPQEIQKLYPNYQELVSSLKQVNDILLVYSVELRRFIKNEI
ncbi:MAG: hypothetical protein MUF45_00030 [Spirosomaceae bacterium]|jgi:Skp family chaperone for outer membrane proteins|nr:hypothetical protein [Spirosomataceae bacterium]